MREMNRKEKQKENICFVNGSRFYCKFLIKFNKVLSAVIPTVNYLVYAINGEV